MYLYFHIDVKTKTDIIASVSMFLIYVAFPFPYTVNVVQSLVLITAAATTFATASQNGVKSIRSPDERTKLVVVTPPATQLKVDDIVVLSVFVLYASYEKVVAITGLTQEVERISIINYPKSSDPI